MSPIPGRLNDLIFRDYAISYRALGLFRLVFAFSALMVLTIPQFGWLEAAEDFMYDPPPGLASLFGGFPPTEVLKVVDTLLVLCVLGIGIGWKTPIWSIAFTCLNWLGWSWVYSLGKIDHNGLLWVLPLILSFHWGRALSLDARKRIHENEGSVGWPVFICALIVGFAYFSASIPKIEGGWLNTGASMFEGYFKVSNFGGPHADLFSILMAIESDVVWESMDWLAVIFEFGFLFALLYPPLFRTFCLVALGFHLFVILTLKIGFDANGPMLLFFIWAPLIKAKPNQSLPLWTVILLVISAILCLITPKVDLEFLLDQTINPGYQLVVISGSLLLGIAGYAGLLKSKIPVNTHVEVSRRPRAVVIGICTLVVLLFSQFVFRAFLAEPYPAILMPSFKKVKLHTDKIHKTKVFLLVKCANGDEYNVTKDQLLRGLKNSKMRFVFKRVYLGKLTRAERKSVERHIGQLFGAPAGEWVTRLRNRRMSVEQHQQMLEWTIQRCALITSCDDIVRMETVRASSTYLFSTGEKINDDTVQSHLIYEVEN